MLQYMNPKSWNLMCFDHVQSKAGLYIIGRHLPLRNSYIELLLEENSVTCTFPWMMRIHHRNIKSPQKLESNDQFPSSSNVMILYLTSTNNLFRFIIAIGIPRHFVFP